MSRYTPEEMQAMREEFLFLRPEFAEVLDLFQQGKSPKAIAQQLQWHLSTINRRLARMRAMGMLPNKNRRPA